jgi:hypothetical protein
LIPGVIAATALLVTLVGLGKPRLFAFAGELRCQPSTSASLLSMLAAIAAVIVMAFATRTLGLLPSVWVAGSLAALGVGGVSLMRACMIGAGLAITAALLFVGLLRQPLPLLPGIW